MGHLFILMAIRGQRKVGMHYFNSSAKKKTNNSSRDFFFKFLRELHNHKNVSAVNEYKVSLRGQYK